MSTLTRTDCHRPSVIDPSEYEFVGVEYDKADTIDEVYSLAFHREQIRAHRERTGGRYSTHAHGGNCHVCGAHCIYTALFYHHPSGVYIRTGFDCAEKLGACDASLFESFRKDVHDARLLKAGKNKAAALLSDAGLSRAWELYGLRSDPDALAATPGCTYDRGDDRPWTSEYSTLVDIVGKLVRYGSISDGQEKYLGRLVDEIDDGERLARERAEKREAEHAAAAPAPIGRVTFSGRPLSVKRQWSQFGVQTKWLIVSDDGWRTWGTVPAAIESELWDTGLLAPGYDPDDPPRLNRDKPFRVTMTATVKPSDDDPKFAFYSRPSKASLLVG